MIEEALTTKLTRERVAAIKKFMPLRGSVRNKLQRRQETQTDFSTDTQQLFSPITSVAKHIKTSTERALFGDIHEEGKR